MVNPKSIHSSVSNKFRTLIIAARKEAGISQEILAKRLSITPILGIEDRTWGASPGCRGIYLLVRGNWHKT